MEVVGGLLAAEQVVSTSVEAGAVGAYAIRKPTLPLRATLKRFAVSPDDIGPDSLARFGHTIAFLNDDVYIFGGQVSQDELAGNELHILKLSNLQGHGPHYQAVPALPAQEGDDVPCPRTGHTLVAADGKLVLFGGYSDLKSRAPIDENGRVWTYSPGKKTWTYIDPATKQIPARHSHAAVAFADSIIIHGGLTNPNSPASRETWQFSMSSHEVKSLASIPSHSEAAALTLYAPPNFTIIDNHLYLLSHSDSSDNIIHSLDLSTESGSVAEWITIEKPSNPLTPEARPRRAGGIVPITTGYGRNYLLLILGAKEEMANSAYRTATAINDTMASSSSSATAPGTPAVPPEDVPESWSDIWALQLPSGTSTAASAKDVARSKLGLEDHVYEWAEVDILTPDAEAKNLVSGSEGKQHPGPRSWLACAPLDGQRVIFWGGLGPKGTAEGDGWILDIKQPEGEMDGGIIRKVKQWTGMES